MASLEYDNQHLEPAPAIELSVQSSAFVSRPPSAGRRALVRRALIAADLLAITVAFELTFLLIGAASGESAGVELGIVLASLPAWLLLAAADGLYGNDVARPFHPLSDDLASVVRLVTIGMALTYGGLAVASGRPPDLAAAGVSWALLLVLVSIGRGIARAWCRRQTAYKQRTLIVGAGVVGQRLARKVQHHPEYGIELVGFVDDSPLARSAALDRLDVLGGTGDLLALTKRHGVERVMIAFSGDELQRTLESTRSLAHHGVRVDIVPRLFDLIGPSTRVDMLEAFPILTMSPAGVSRASDIAKRLLDIAVASIGLVLTAPLLAFIAWRVRHDSEGPVLFRQTRLGLHQREFTAFKFRTMRTNVDTDQHRLYIERSLGADAVPDQNGLFKLDQSSAVTPSGRWLRGTSLDELPQLLNVLRGDMSIVGPRPCIPYETRSFEPHHFERFGVRPGITGLWQVTARAHSTFGEALDMDVAYARARSFALDLRLILRTPGQLLGRGVTR